MTKPAQERCGVCNWPIVDNGTRIEHVGFDHPAEPAATVHGTGSGDATCQCWNYMSDGCDLHGNRPLPTPPASNTVTLDREQCDKIELWLNSIRNCEEACDGCRRMVDLALALLRAAERQK